MKKVHKINMYFIWVCTVCLNLPNLLSGAMDSKQSLETILVTVGASVIVTALVYVKLNNVAKGSLITIVIGLATLFLSIITGGNAYTFWISFLVLGLALMYFSKKIIFFYSVSYLAACVVAAMVNTEYITGPDGSITNLMLRFVTYVLLSALMVVATARGENFIMSADKHGKELEENAKLFKDLSNKLHDAVLVGQQEILNVKNASTVIEDASGQMEVAVEDTSKSIISVNERVVDSQNNISKNYSMSVELTKQFEQVVESVNNGNTQGKQVEAAVNHVSSVMDEAKNETENLIEETKHIYSILDEINSIAKQTNLLSLNASIEAARAGEAGRGFAVVAEEIRSLSEESKKSADNIGQILSSFQSMIENVAKKVISGTDELQEGNAKLQELLAHLDVIDERAVEAKNVLNEEFNLIETIEKDFNSISLEVGNVVAISEENTAMITNINETLKNQEDALETTAMQFEDIRSLSEQLTQ